VYLIFITKEWFTLLKVVIVDDEKWVCRLISKIIMWDQIGMKLIHEINDGCEAFNIISKEKPDIVITDIRMPGLDGISLIKKLKESNIDAKFIIISGYQDFNYAQKALKYGVKDYILKPIEEDELRNSLLRLKESILIEQKRAVEETKLKILFEQNLDKLREQFFSKLLFENSYNSFDLDELNKEYKLNFKEGLYQVIVFKLDSIASKKENGQIDGVILAKVAELLRSGFKNNCFSVHDLIQASRIILILNYDDENRKHINSDLKRVFMEAVNQVHMYKGFYLTAGIGSVEHDIKMLKKSLNAAVCSVQSRLRLGLDRIIDISKLSYSDLSLADIYPNDKEREFYRLIEILDADGTEKYLTELFTPLFDMPDINPCLVVELGHRIIKMLIKAIQEINLQTDEFTDEEKIDERIDDCKSFSELLNSILKHVKTVLEICKKIRLEKKSRPIEIVKEYISRHYSEPISLTDMANLVYLNPTYFSELFKKETGKNFSEYLIDYRMESARNLLKDIRYNVSDVAEMVGYKDVNHFSKMFKKSYGINAGQYKKLYT
jgi:two-component system response regulator YesN